MQHIDVTAGDPPSKARRASSGARARDKKKFLLQRSFIGDSSGRLGGGRVATLLRRMRRLARRLLQFGADDDGPAAEWKGLAYLRVGCVLALAIFDIVTALTVQIFWLDRSSLVINVIHSLSCRFVSLVQGVH